MRTILTWVLSVLVAVAFLGAGFAKLTSQPMMIEEFATFGLPVWFMYVTGVIEVASAVLVLVPRYAFIGSGLLVCTMVCALFAHLTHGQAAMIAAPLVLLVLAAVVGTLRGWGRRPGALIVSAINRPRLQARRAEEATTGAVFRSTTRFDRPDGLT